MTATILTAGVILSPSTGIEVEAVVIERGVIRFAGALSAATEIAGSDAVIMNHPDAFVVPGLVDPHAHVTSGLDYAVGADLSGCTTLVQVQDALRQEAARTPAGLWVRGWGLDGSLLEPSGATFDPLEDAVSHRPAYLRAFDAHSAYVSAAGLQQAGVTAPRVFPTGSSVAARPDGTPSGRLIELEAISLVETTLPKPTLTERAHTLLDALDRMAAAGLTLVHSLSFRPGDRDLLEAAERIRDLPVYLVFSPAYRAHFTEADVEELLRMQEWSGRRWRVSGVKFFLDGTVDNGTAWLSHPDVYGERGAPGWPEPRAYRDALVDIARRRISTATHAIGDAAAAFAVSTASEAVDTYGTVHRVEHIELASPSTIAALGRSGVVASMQPIHAVIGLSALGNDAFTQRVGLERRAGAFPIADIWRTGATVMLGSDWPSGTYDPRQVLAAACSPRPVPDGTPVEAVRDQTLPPVAALRSMTRHIARDGTLVTRDITEGQPATFTVFDRDPRDGDAFDASVGVRLTMIDGQVASPPDAPLTAQP